MAYLPENFAIFRIQDDDSMESTEVCLQVQHQLNKFFDVNQNMHRIHEGQ